MVKLSGESPDIASRASFDPHSSKIVSFTALFQGRETVHMLDCGWGRISGVLRMQLSNGGKSLGGAS